MISMKEQQIKKVYYNGKQYTKAYCNGKLIWSVMERPQDDNSEYLNVFELKVAKCYYPYIDVKLHNLFGVHMKTEVNGQVIYDDDNDEHIVRLYVEYGQDMTYRIRTNGYINFKMDRILSLFVTRVDKFSLPQINNIPLDKEDNLRFCNQHFYNLLDLKHINLSQLDLSNCENAHGMFCGVGWGLVNYQTMGYDKCEIVGADKTEFYAPKSISRMFSHCRINMDNFNWINTKNVEDMSYCFENFDTNGIEELHLENWDTRNVLYTEGMFSGLHDIVILVGGNWTLSTEPDAYGGKNLTIIVSHSTR